MVRHHANTRTDGEPMCVRRDLCPLAISRQRFYSFLFKKVFIFLCHLNLPNDQHYCTAKCLLVPPCRCPVSSVARTGNGRAKSPLQTDRQPTKKSSINFMFYVWCGDVATLVISQGVVRIFFLTREKCLERLVELTATFV